ncbi:MAG: hypothetical protein GKR90_10940 [Pseudomonadales bacterium]|nr:hypothetical protein [Pseudomonadales bacterium]
MKLTFAPTLILTSLVFAGTAQANPYGHWQSQASDDDQIKVSESFNRSSEYTRTEDNDIALSLAKTHSEDNDVTTSVVTSEDNDYSSDYRTSEDNDYLSVYKHTEDNDVTEDNDYTHTEDNDTDVAVDFQIATPTLTSYKFQDQDAGHEADTTVLGAARGHAVSTVGGPTVVSAGNDSQRVYGPSMVNNNTNQLPQNNLMLQGGSAGPISQGSTFAGRDLGPKGVFGPVGNTSATVWGDVDQTSAAQVGQSGDSSNSIADVMNGSVSK